jgi:hypothetical protein
MKRLAVVILAVMVAGVALFTQSRTSAQEGLQGAWRMTAVTTTGPKGSTNSSPQPGLMIFTGKHYSMIRINRPRPNLPDDVQSTTKEQLLAIYGDALTAQTGTYEVSGSKVTIRPLVASRPNYMVPTSWQTFEYKIEGKTLTFTAAGSYRGPARNPTTWTWSRAE